MTRALRLALAVLLISPGPLAAQEDHSGLTRAKYVQNCLMCHNRAAPDGLSPDILARLAPQPELKPAVAMPGVACWRRCDRCFAPAPRRR